MGGRRRRKHEKEMMEMQQQQLDQQQEEREVQREILEKQKQEYREFQFVNPYEDMENYYEDLTVDTRAAEFQMQQATQARANIMQQFRGAAGASGIAGLAQALANQGTLQAQQISASISQQEQQNRLMAAKGASAADMADRGGAAMVQQAEMARQANLLGLEFGGMAGANAAVQSAYANQLAAAGYIHQGYSARAQAWATGISGVAQGVGTAKVVFKCVPKGIRIDTVDNSIAIENIKPGDIVMGYNGSPVKVLQKHEYLEDPTKERFYKVKFDNGSVVDVCDMHRINGVRSKNITKGVVNKEVYGGVEFSYDLLTEDMGYRIDGVPVNSMIEEMAELIVKFK